MSLLHPIDEGPLHISVSTNAHLPGVHRACFSFDERLWSWVKERHSVSLVYSGRSEWWSRGRTWTSKPGSLLLKEAGEVHRDLARDGPSRFQVLSFDTGLVEQAAHAFGLRLEPDWTGQLDRTEPAGVPLAHLHEILQSGEDDALTLQTALTEALQALVGQSCKARSRRGENGRCRPVRLARDYLRTRLSEPVTLLELSQVAGLDRFHLCRAFRREVGLPPHAYQVHLRVIEAKRLLGEGVAPSEAAIQVGFYDQSQLHRHFRRIVGLAPGRYQRSILARPRGWRADEIRVRRAEGAEMAPPNPGAGPSHLEAGGEPASLLRRN